MLFFISQFKVFHKDIGEFSCLCIDNWYSQLSQVHLNFDIALILSFVALLHINIQLVLCKFISVRKSYDFQVLFVQDFKQELSFRLFILKNYFLVLCNLVNFEAAKICFSTALVDRYFKQFFIKWVAPGIWNDLIRPEDIKVIWTRVHLLNLKTSLR